jgi:hypothetical protein
MGAGGPYVLKVGDTMTGRLTINMTTAGNMPAAIGSPVLNMAGPDGLNGRFQLTGFGSGTSFIGQRANGTNAAPTGLMLGNIITQFAAHGYGATGFNATTGGDFHFVAAETWTDTAQGTAFNLRLCANGGAVLTNALGMNLANGLSMYSSANIVIDNNRLLKRRAFTFATLPAAATSTDGFAMITDGAAAPACLGAAAGGGAVRTPVHSNGAAWING